MAEIEDTLDAGLIFDNSTAVIVTPGSGNLSTSLGDFSNVITTVNTTGNSVSFNLGDITNTAPHGSVETLTVAYRVYVANDALNAGAGETLNNAADFRWDIDGDGSNVGSLDGTTEDAAPDVTVIVPELQIAKTISTLPNDAGDAVVYQFVIDHSSASQAAAFDATFSDTLPPELSNVSVLSAVDSSGNPVTGFSVSGNTVTNNDFDLALGDNITLAVGANVNTTASASTTVDNVAQIDWDTLGDDAQGNQSVESGGSALDNIGFVIASPEFSKEIASTGIDDSTNNNIVVVAGEYITYALTVTVPEGTTPMVQITDVLHNDLRFDNSYLITATGSSGVTFSGSPGTPVVTGSNVAFDLGTVVNTNTDDAIEDTVTITYRTFADSDVLRGDILPNAATLRWDADNDGDNTDPDDGTRTDATSVQVVTPNLVVEKSVTVIPSDAGDPVEYQMVIRHSDVSDTPAVVSDTTAYDVVFNDQVPAGIDNVLVTSAINSAGNPVSGFSVIGNLVQHTGFDLPIGESITVTVNATASALLVEGDTITNFSEVAWSTLDDTTDDGIDASEKSDTTSDFATFSLSNIDKTVLDTGINDASNDNQEVVTGEYITYQIVVEVPQGQSNLAEIEDMLDPGLVLNTDYPLSVVPSSSNLSTSLGSFNNPVPVVDPFTNLLSIGLGDIVNAAPTGTVETLTVTYQVYVANSEIDAGVGAALKNAVEFKWDIDLDGDNNGAFDGTTLAAAPEVVVIAPELEILKSVFTVPGDAGDSIDYQFLIRHTGNSQAAAFDATFSDTLPSELSNVQVTSAFDSSGNPVAGFSVSGNTVSHTDFDLALGDTITLTVNAMVNTTASASTTVVNTADINWQTLGDDSQGYQPVESSGSATDNAGFVVASPSFTKEIFSTGINNSANDNSEVVAGEYTTYALTVTVPEGTTPMAQITDTLDTQLLFDTAYTVSAVSSDGVSFSGAPGLPQIVGSQVIFDLGTIVNTNTDNNAADTVTIYYRAYAATQVATSDKLVNTAEFVWDADNNGSNDTADDGRSSASEQVTTITPELSVSKRVTLMPGDAGDPVEYEITVSHTVASGADAYDVQLIDVVPNGISDVSVVSAVDNNGLTVPGFDAIGQQVLNNSFDLPFNDQVTVVISGVVNDTAEVGVEINNTAAIQYGTLDSDNPTDGADSMELLQSATGSTVFSIADLQKSTVNTGISTAPNGDLQAAIGEYIDYEVRASLPQGQQSLLEIVDTLAPGLVFDSLLNISATAAVSTSLPGGDFSAVSAPGNGSTGAVSFDLGTVTSADENGEIVIQYRVFAENESSLSAGDTLGNDADLRWDIDNNGSNRDSLDGSTMASAADVSIVEPVVSIKKSVDDIDPYLGQTIHYTLVVTNEDVQFGTHAYDLVVSDTLPADMVLDSASIRYNELLVESVNGVSVVTDGNAFDLSVDNLPYGDHLVVEYSATVTSDTARVDSNLNNTATVDWTSLSQNTTTDGVETAERSVADGYRSESSASVVLTAPDYEITKISTPLGALGTDDSITYTMLVSNVGTHGGTGVTVTDQYPAQLLSVPSFISNGGVYDADAGDILWNIGSLGVNESVTLTVEATVLNPQIANADNNNDSIDDELLNTVSVVDDGLNGGDPDLTNNTAIHTNTIVASPDYSISKTNDIEMAAITEQFVYQIVAANNGTQDGTNVVITDTYPTNILSVVDAGGGVVDESASTITWNIDQLAAGDEINLAIEMRVINEAYLESADQLFTNSVSITDDGRNGTDPTPENNNDSHADMLLAGPGDPAALNPTPAFSSSPFAINTETTSRDIPGRSIDLEPPTFEKRIISSETMRSTQSGGGEESKGRSYEDDPLNGGDLLDKFGNPVMLCEVHWVDNPYIDGQADELPADDLLELFVPADETQNQPAGNHNSLEARFSAESEKINGKSGDDITRLMEALIKAEAEPER